MISNGANTIGAVEIGTGKIAVAIGEIARGRTLHIVGFGLAQSRGVMKGEVVDYKAVSETVHQALEAAEKKAGVRIGEVWLAQTGAHLEGFYNQASANVKSADNTVTRADMQTVCELAREKELPAGRSRVHALRRPFLLDGRSVPDPEHLTGHRLEVGYWIVHGQENKISDNIHVVGGYHLEVTELVLASLASATLLINEEERHHGALMIDLGRGVSDYLLYRDGHVLATGVLPVGGDHLTNDIALGLRVTTTQAELLKLRHGRAVVQTRDKQEKVWLNGDMSFGDRQIPRTALETITAARAQETFEVIRAQLGPRFAPEHCGAGVILTGGASKLPGMEEAASRVFGVPARRGTAPSWVKEDLHDPQFSTVLGVLQFGLLHGQGQRRTGPSSGGILSNLRRFFST